ncbi:MAG: hypothetical protein AB1553_08445 [Nitrospirota bacterium]
MTITTNPGVINLSLFNTTMVGVGRSATLRVTLNPAAPAGGRTVTVMSDNNGTLTVGPPSSIFIPEGETTGQITVNGISGGNVIVRANTPDYAEGALTVEVTVNLISVATTLNVPLGLTTEFPVSIAPNPAPADGVTITLVSSDPSIIEVVTPTITIPAGKISANGTIRGVFPGTAAITASHSSYASDHSQVTTSASLNIVESSVTFTNNLSTPNITIKLQSNGTDIVAPAPGVTVALTAANPDCVSVPATVTIPAGMVSTTRS